MTQGPEKVALSKWQFTKTANKILGRNELAGRSKERVKRSINIRIISLCHQLSNKIIVDSNIALTSLIDEHLTAYSKLSEEFNTFKQG